MTRHRDELSDGLPPWAVATPTGLVPPVPATACGRERRGHVTSGGDATGLPDLVDR